jgi:hypothetical protein
MLMALGGLFEQGWVEWVTSMTYQAASGAGAKNMRELMEQMRFLGNRAAGLLDDPASAILDIDRTVTAALREDCAADGQLRRAPGRQPHSLDRPGHGQRPDQGGMEGHGRGQQDPGP